MQTTSDTGKRKFSTSPIPVRMPLAKHFMSITKYVKDHSKCSAARCVMHSTCRPRHCSKGVQPPRLYLSGCRDKHSCLQWDSVLASYRYVARNIGYLLTSALESPLRKIMWYCQPLWRFALF